MNKSMDIIMNASSDPLVRKQAGLVLPRKSPSRKPTPAHRASVRRPSPTPKSPIHKSSPAPAKQPLPDSRPTSSPKPVQSTLPYQPPVQKPQQSIPIYKPVERPISANNPTQPVQFVSPTSTSITPRQTDKPAFVEHIEHTEYQQIQPPTPTYSSSSPFIDNAEHDKRPLGEVTRATMLLGEDPDYNPALDPRRERPSDPVRKASTRKKLTIPLPLIVLITVILGVASGVGVYFLLSK